MTAHTIPVPDRLQRPVCSCGWSPEGAWPVTWQRFDADAQAHLAEVGLVQQAAARAWARRQAESERRRRHRNG